VTEFLPYGRQLIEDDDLAAVAEALRADMLTTGPRVEAFERAFCEATGAAHAVACSNGTAALHLSMLAAGVGPEDAVVVPSITFLATANAARFVGAEVVFADVDPDTGLMTAETCAEAFQRATLPVKAVMPVHLAGKCVHLPSIAALAAEVGASVIEDACHALGSEMDFGLGRERAGDGRHASLACFSFHPVKTIATGEGGMVTTTHAGLAERLREGRSHGMTRDPDRFERFDGAGEPWWYEQQSLGFNYRLPDLNCALGISQLAKLPRFVERRRALAAAYDAALAPLAPLVSVAPTPEGQAPALHLYVALVDFRAAGVSRAEVMARLRAKGIGTQVHYIPVHRQPYYQDRYGQISLFGAEAWYDRCLSLPLFPGMADGDPQRVAEALAEALGAA
jgi:UDP-4-amino-4,6-dideoxy-N-acetyl-beta-L-altrosamine transaminase